MSSSSLWERTRDRVRWARKALRRTRPEDRSEYIVSQSNPECADVLSDFRFFAVVGTWMEEDIVESTVRNAFIQGVEKVFLVDNASTDATVERAVAAGASLVETYRTDTFQETLRTLFMNAVVARESLACGAEHVWWLWLDADEFPEGPNGTSIADYLGTLDRRFRVVGSSYYNHFPTTKPANVPGVHPVDLQPMCTRFVKPLPIPLCGQEHWKHPLQRFDRSELMLVAVPGFHTARIRSKNHLLEPQGGIVTHHFQYREEEATRARLELACDPQRARLGLYDNFLRRKASLDAVYAQRWGEVDNRGGSAMLTEVGVSLERWSGGGLRWYDSAAAVDGRAMASASESVSGEPC